MQATSTAHVQGSRWGAGAADWAALTAGHARPAWEALAERTGIGPRSSVLDLGCGSGEFCELAAGRGAAVAGIDAAPEMIELARARVPGADLRVGPVEELPFDDDSFDVVTAFNSLQFSADICVALGEARRVARPRASVSVCNWAGPEHNDLFAIFARLRELHAPPPPGATPPAPPAVGAPGVLEQLARDAGLEPVDAGEVDVPFEVADEQTLLRALLAPGGVVPALEHAGAAAVRETVAAAAESFRRNDGSYRFEARFRYVISSV